MGTLGQRWAGRAFGTNTGNIYAEFETDGGNTTGTLRFMDSELGLAQFTVAGAFDGNRIQLTGTPLAVVEGVEQGTLTIQGQLSPDGQIRGDWESTLGTAGTFVLHPHDISLPAPGAAPEQLHTAVRTLGALRLYAADVRELVVALGRDLNNPRVVATYRDRGTEVSRYAEDFLADSERVARLDYLKLGVSEPEAYGLNRNVTVELDASGANEVRVQSVQESWALGKAESLSQTLRKNQKSFVTTVRRFGLNLNTVIVIVTVAVVPELSLGRRFLFLVFALFLVVGVIRFHAKFIPNVAIYLAGVKPGLLRRSWPQILSWLVAGTSAVAASIVYGLLKNEITLQHIAKVLWPWSH